MTTDLEQDSRQPDGRGYLRKGRRPGSSVFVVNRGGGTATLQRERDPVAPLPEREFEIEAPEAAPRSTQVKSIPGYYHHAEHEEHGHPTHFWLLVLCLTGVDYFSTLAYQPGIAFNATG